MGKHIASYGMMGNYHRGRIGTHFCNTFEHVAQHIGEPYFRFRNEECRREYIEWKLARSALAKKEGST